MRFDRQMPHELAPEAIRVLEQRLSILRFDI
jgi:hypothetical protein